MVDVAGTHRPDGKQCCFRGGIGDLKLAEKRWNARVGVGSLQGGFKKRVSKVRTQAQLVGGNATGEIRTLRGLGTGNSPKPRPGREPSIKGLLIDTGKSHA